MPPLAPLSRTGWDPERHARRLVPWGALLAAGGLYVGGWGGVAAFVVGMLCLLASAYSSRDGLLLLGPFARYELSRIARTKRPQLWRVIYALAVAALLFFNFLAYAPDVVTQGQLEKVRHRNLIQTANNAFFIWYSICLILYVAVLAVTQFSSLVAEERAGKRWDVLLTTDLRPRELLFGKAAGRVPQLLDPILASIPVLTIATLFGGVSPTMVLLVAVAALSFAFGIGGMAAFYSVFCPTPAKAASNVFGVGFIYLTLSGIAAGVATSPGAARVPASGGKPWPMTVADIGSLFAAGNPIAVTALEDRRKPPGESVEEAIARATRKFAAFHLGVGLFFGFVAGRRLRTAEPWGVNQAVTVRRALAERVVLPDRAGESLFRRRHVSAIPKRPPVSDRPIAWWEWFGGMTTGQVGTVQWLTNRRNLLETAGLALLLFVIARIGVWAFQLSIPGRPGRDLETVLSAVVLFTIWLIHWPMLLGPLFRAVRTVAKERAADTLEPLRTLPLDPREIIFQKWLGCVQSAIPFGTFALCMLVPGVLTGFVSILSLVGVVVAVPVYVMSLAGYGLFFSATAKTPARATFAMVLTTALLGFAAAQVLSVLAPRPTHIVDREQQTAFLMAQFPPAAVAAMLAGPMSTITLGPFFAYGYGLAVSLALFATCGGLAYRLAVKQFEHEDARARCGGLPGK